MKGPGRQEYINAAKAMTRLAGRQDAILPNGWTKDQLRDPGLGWFVVPEFDSNDGRMWRSTDGLRVIASVAQELDGKFWLHISFSRKDKIPGWFDMKRVKNAFIGQYATAIQVFPPEAQYVNIRETVLHLWHCMDGNTIPDFTHGTGSI